MTSDDAAQGLSSEQTAIYSRQIGEPNISGHTKRYPKDSQNLTNCNTASEWLFRDETVRIAEAPTVFARAERQFARERP